jgi:hypothetical protein
MTLATMLAQQRKNFGESGKPLPAEFSALWDWATLHGIVQPQ